VQPPHPFELRVTSMIQLGAATSLLGFLTDANNVFQSPLFEGAKSLVPLGQLSLSELLETFKHFVHFSSAPAEYTPFSLISSHLHVEGLPFLGFVEIVDNQHPFVLGNLAQNSSTGIFFLHAKHLAIFFLQQIFQGGAKVVVVVFFFTTASWQ
jgi:hypothetical protein